MVRGWRKVDKIPRFTLIKHHYIDLDGSENWLVIGEDGKTYKIRWFRGKKEYYVED